MSKNDMVTVPRELLERCRQFTLDIKSPICLRLDLDNALTDPAAHQGEPIPITNDMHRLMEAYRLGEFTAEGGSDTIEALAVAAFDAVADQGHDADSYMAGFCASLYWWAAPFIGLAIKPITHADPADPDRIRTQLLDLAVAIHKRYYAKTSPEFQPFDFASGLIGQIDNMVAGLLQDVGSQRAQLAEAQALLREVLVGLWPSTPMAIKINAALSASAEPSAPKCKNKLPCLRPDLCGICEPSAPVEKE